MGYYGFPGYVRRLVQKPGFSLALILTLALSIGASTAVFSLVSALLLRPQPDPIAGVLERSSLGSVRFWITFTSCAWLQWHALGEASPQQIISLPSRTFANRKAHQ